MADLSIRLREILKTAQGKEVNLADLRKELNIDPSSSANANLRMLMSVNFVNQGLVKPSGRRDGVYKVIKRVEPVRVFIPGRELRPEVDLRFPEDKATGMEIGIAEEFVIREGDLITLGGVKNRGKTLLCLNFAAVNIDRRPILMGNEYTVLTKEGWEPQQRFLSRLKRMAKKDIIGDKGWVNWTDEKGNDKFTLYPVREDYEDHIVRDSINIIDWINIEGEFWEISPVLEGIKRHLGRGIAIVALQKREGAIDPRGGQFTEDFSDVMLLLDGYGDTDILMTVKIAKETRHPVMGKTFAYSIVEGGTQLWNFREVKKCVKCRGSGYTGGGTCSECRGKKFVDT